MQAIDKFGLKGMPRDEVDAAIKSIRAREITHTVKTLPSAATRGGDYSLSALKVEPCPDIVVAICKGFPIMHRA